jgi:hypothetical protein
METDRLNPTQTHVYNPTYSYRLEDEDDLLFQPRSGSMYMREVDVRGCVYSLQWLNMQASDALGLRNWDQQFRRGFFSYQDFDRSRYFSGRFLNKLKLEAIGNNNYNVAGIFIEIPNLAMFAYPSVWGTPNSIFWEQNDDFGNAITKQTGVWTPGTNANAHGSATDELSNTNLNTTDMIELEYIGYGFRLWSRKDTNLGIYSVSTKVNGIAEVAPTNVDLYAAAPAAAAAVYTNASLKLARRRVTLTATNTKNASSSAKTTLFDAIEIMK